MHTSDHSCRYLHLVLGCWLRKGFLNSMLQREESQCHLDKLPSDRHPPAFDSKTGLDWPAGPRSLSLSTLSIVLPRHRPSLSPNVSLPQP